MHTGVDSTNDNINSCCIFPLISLLICAFLAQFIFITFSKPVLGFYEFHVFFNSLYSNNF